MSKVSKKTKIATVLIGAFALVGSNLVIASPLTDAQQADSVIHAEAATSQQKVDKYVNQAQDMLFEYGSVADERESLKAYNDYVAVLVADQQASMKSIQGDIDGVDALRQGVVPLMFKMVDALDQFVELDLPFNKDVRVQRVENLRTLLTSAEVTLAEKYRLILDAYSIERDYGTSLTVKTGKLELDGKEALVDFLNLGRVALYAQSLDGKSAWMFNDETKAWDKLDDSYLRDMTKGIRIARKQTAADLFSLPIPAAETAQ